MPELSLRPRPHHVFIDRHKAEKSDSGKLFLARDIEKPTTIFRGTVVALGEGCPDLLKTGDVVVFPQVEAFEFLAGEDFWLFDVPERVILAVEAEL
jgi:co-chaperonin GroES (HSP10)